jgi:methylase of polypeptide subunit release factors
VVLLESSPATVAEVSSLLLQRGFQEVQVHLDLAGRERFVSAVRR